MENFDDIQNISIGEKFAKSYEILIEGLKAFFMHPVLLIPIFIGYAVFVEHCANMLDRCLLHHFIYGTKNGNVRLVIPE